MEKEPGSEEIIEGEIVGGEKDLREVLKKV